jgi:hypothetical protein
MLLLLLMTLKKKMMTNSIQYFFINMLRHQPDGHKQRHHNIRTQKRIKNRTGTKQTQTKQTEEFLINYGTLQ